VGAIRASNAVAALRRRGHEVIVIAAEHALAGATPNIHRVVPKANVSTAFRRHRKTRASGAREHSAVRPGMVPAEPMPLWKQVVLSILLLPDESQGYVWPAVRRAVRTLDGGYDVIVTTAPPHSVTVAGLLLKMRSRLPWVAELRDPWTDNPIKPPYHTRLRAAAISFLERICLRQAGAIISVTESTGARLRSRVADPSKVVVIRNGVPAHLSHASPLTTGDEPFRIVHGGTLYGRRDPRPLISALAAVRRAGGSELPERVHLEFVGDCAWYEPLIREAARALAPGDRLILHGSQSRGLTAEMLASADLLLLLAQDQPLQVPQKLYDYLAARRPILGFVDRLGESAAMLNQTGGHFLAHSTEPSEARSILERALSSARAPFETDEQLLEAWSVENQMERLVDVVEAAGRSCR
jgi:hypothetical protein